MSSSFEKVAVLKVTLGRINGDNYSSEKTTKFAKMNIWKRCCQFFKLTYSVYFFIKQTLLLLALWNKQAPLEKQGTIAFLKYSSIVCRGVQSPT